MTTTWRHRVHEALGGHGPDAPPGRAWLSYGLTTLIGLNVLAVILESVDGVALRWGRHFALFELVSVAVFTVEYFARLWIAPEEPRYARPFVGRFRYALGPLPIIDLLAILPTYLLLVGAGGIDLRFLRVLRFFRLMRVLKLGRYSPALQTLGHVFASRRADLMVAVAAVGVLLVVASSALYLVEHDAQPDKFSSIPATMWWGIITLTTIGYGDTYPVTPEGQLIGGITAILGVGVAALPAAILATGFMQAIEERKKRVQVATPATCPHCGKDVHEAAPAPAPRTP